MQRYALTQVAAPGEELLSADEVKLHLRIEQEETVEDSLLTRLIAAARRQAEAFTGRALITQTWDMDLDGFLSWEIDIPRPPLQSVESVGYMDVAGVVHTLPASSYRVDAKRTPGRITPTYGQAWPATRDVTSAVGVRFVAGYGAVDGVPEDIQQAVLLIVGRLYAHREDVVVGSATRMPLGAESLLGPYRVVRV